ncbi:MAG: HAMP domain-containing protein [Bacteroidales bacterium]|nr:HAMP domain-containing protein [Bacteroidales bacterium]
MKNRSFRSIIILTLLIVISTISFSAFLIYSKILERKIYSEHDKNVSLEVSILNLLKDQIYYTCGEHDESVIKTLHQKMKNNDQILNSYIYDAEENIKFSLKNDSSDIASISHEEILASQKGVRIKSFPTAEIPFSRAFINLPNSPSCYECHSQEIVNLGYMVIDLSKGERKDINVFTRKSSLIFTLVMIFIIILFILLIHYRFVRKSLREFHSTIKSINQGNLQTRLSIPETKELGLLGKNFNNMLDTFQRTQKELQEFHKKELRSNYKLATIGEIAARLAHEIRNPITGIANAIEIIVADTKDEQNIPILEEVQRQAKRVNHAVSDVLKYSRKKNLNFILNDINELIKKVAFFLKNQVNQKEILFDLELQDDIPLFKFDNEQMEDVLLNIGLNAIQAISKDGSIIFKTTFTPNEKRIYIYVIDTGKGIPEDDLLNIFHPFYTTRNEGTGLGLAIVKDIINKHKGEIWVDNNKTNGCTFTISLLVSDE